MSQPPQLPATSSRYGNTSDVQEVYCAVFRSLTHDLQGIQQISGRDQMLNAVQRAEKSSVYRKSSTWSTRLNGVAMAVDAFASRLAQISSFLDENGDSVEWRYMLWGSIATMLQLHFTLGFCPDQSIQLVELLTVSPNLLRFRALRRVSEKELKINMLQILAEVACTLGEAIVALRTQPPPLKRPNVLRNPHDIEPSVVERFRRASGRIANYADVATESVLQETISTDESLKLPFDNTTDDMLSRRFFGRHHYLHEMKALLSQGQPNSNFHLALHGLPGVGKTQLALRYIHQYRLEYDVIVWTAAASTQKIRETLARVAYEMGLNGCGLDVKTEERAQNALSWLRITEKKWLIVYDNVDDMSVIEPFRVRSNSGHVLVTTRDPRSGVFPVENGLLVKPFSQEESKEFFFQNFAEEHWDKVPPKLESWFQEWDGLPMALDQMGSYIKENKLTLSAFSRMYEKNRPKVHSMHQSYAREWGYYNTTATALSIRTLQDDSRALLHAIAFLDPDRIFDESGLYGEEHERSVLLNVFEDQFSYFQAVDELVMRSLLQKDANGFRVHRLVQAVSFDDMTTIERHEMYQRLLALLSDAFPSGVMGDWLLNEWARCEHYYLHIECLLVYRGLVSHDAACNEDVTLRKLVSTCTWYMFERGYFSEADRLLCNAIPVLESGNDRSASLRYTLAGIRNECNRIAEAKALVEEVIITQERLLEPNDLALGNTYKSAAVVYMESGELDEAFDLLNRALQIAGDVDKAQAAATHANLTHCSLRIGKLREASEHAEKGYILSLEACGEQSDRFSEAVFDLANVRLLEYRHQEAFDLHNRALDIRLAVTPTHDKTGHSMHKMATLYQSRGDLEQALAHVDRAIAIYEHNFDHVPRVARSKFKRFQILDSLGRLAEAQDARSEASKLRKSITTFPVTSDETEEAYDLLVCSWFR